MVKKFALIISVFSSLAIGQKLNIAILQFDAANIPDAEVRILTDRLSTELINIGTFNVVERSIMEEVLQEQGFQQSGCTSNECVVEVGKLVGVEQMVTGSMGKIGSIYTISARLIDVETGRVLSQKSIDCPCPIETLLMSTMKDLATGLASDDAIGRPITEVLSYGGVFFKGQNGVELWQGDNLVGTVPFQQESLATGNYEYLAKLEGYNNQVVAFTVEENRIVDVPVDLELITGILKVRPPIKGETYSLTIGDNSLQELKGSYTFIAKPGLYGVKVSKHGYRDSYYEAEIIADSVQTLSPTLDLTKVPVSFNVNPIDADIIFNKQAIASNTVEMVPFGAYDYSIKAKGYKPQSGTLEILSDESKSLVVELTPKSKSRARKMSFALPGSGQLYSGRNLAGAGYLITTVALVAVINGAVSDLDMNRHKMNSLHSTYLNAKSPDLITESRQNYVDQVEVVKNGENLVISAAAGIVGVWMLNIIDAYFFTDLPGE